MTRAPCRRRTGEAVVRRAEKFGDLIRADHKVLSEGSESRNNHRFAIVVQDLATQWIQSYPCKTKTSQETQRSLQKFLELGRKPDVIYTDNSLEFGKACEALSWNHCTSTPHRSETDGIAERAVRRVKEGTSAVLLQSDLNESWWADSMECYTYLRNVTDLLSDGKTPCERRFGQPFNGPIIPSGSSVEYHLVTAKDQSRIRRFGKKVLPGLFLGYACTRVDFGRVTYWLQTFEELETMDASEIYSKRLNAKEVFGMCCIFLRILKPLTTCFIDHSLMCLTHFLSFFPRHLRLHSLHLLRLESGDLPVPLCTKGFSLAAWSNLTLSHF